MAYNTESFCSELWSQLEISPNGDYKICCLANSDFDYGRAFTKHAKVMNVMTHSIQDALNSETHKHHRLQLKQNIQPKRCQACYDGERANGGSKRQRITNDNAINIPEYVTIDTADDYTAIDGSVTSKVVSLDIRFGNLCNYKCIMCNPEFSSLWEDDWQKIKHKNDKNQVKRIDIKTENWWETNIWWNQFDEIAPDLRHIYFTGGEPLLVPEMQKCLDKLINGGYAKDIILRYDTNLSVINDKVIDKWKHFKDIDLCISVDEIDDRYNLIRNPGNFNKFINNIKKIKDRGIKISYLSSCIGIATIYTMPRIIALAESLGCKSYFRFLLGPEWLNIRNLPKSAKLEIISNLAKLDGPEEHQRFYKAEINLLTQFLEFEDQTKIQDFVDIMDILDNSRNTQWRNTLPDVYDIIQRHCPNVTTK